MKERYLSYSQSFDKIVHFFYQFSVSFSLDPYKLVRLAGSPTGEKMENSRSQEGDKQSWVAMSSKHYRA